MEDSTHPPDSRQRQGGAEAELDVSWLVEADVAAIDALARAPKGSPPIDVSLIDMSQGEVPTTLGLSRRDWWSGRERGVQP